MPGNRGRVIAEPYPDAGGRRRAPPIPRRTLRENRTALGLTDNALAGVRGRRMSLAHSLTTRMKRHEAVLNRRGRQTLAVVTATNDHFRWLPDTATVRYEHDGRRYDADVTVGRTTDFRVGSQVGVVYDPDDPSHAKPVEGWSPSYEMAMLSAFAVLGLGVVNSAPRTVRTVLLLRTATSGAGPATTMWVESFMLSRWWQRWPRQWAALWPLDADPLRVDAQLYAPIEDLTNRTAISVEQPSTVLGTVEPRRLHVVIHDDRVVWPRGRARSDPPRGSIVEGHVQGQMVSASWEVRGRRGRSRAPNGGSQRLGGEREVARFPGAGSPGR